MSGTKNMNGTSVLRRVGVGVAAVLMAGAGIVVSAGSASADVSLCVKMISKYSGRHTIEVPADSGNRDTCLLGRGSAANTKIVTRFQLTMIRCYGGLALASPYQHEKIRDLDADGDFGPRTEAALKAVQKNVGINADGTYGPVTRDNMSFMASNGGCLPYR